VNKKGEFWYWGERINLFAVCFSVRLGSHTT